MNVRNKEFKEVKFSQKIYEFQTSELIKLGFFPYFKKQQCARINQER